MRGHSTRTFNAEHDKRKKKADTRNRFQHHIDLFGFTNSLLLTDLEIYITKVVQSLNSSKTYIVIYIFI